MQEAAVLDITLGRGADLNLTVDFTYEDGGAAVSFAGCSASMEVRDPADGTVLLSPDVTFPAPATQGRMLLSATDAEISTAFPGPHSPAAVYDVLVTDSNTVKEFWLKGVFQVEDAR